MGSLNEPLLPQCLRALYSAKLHNLKVGGQILPSSSEDRLFRSTNIMTGSINRDQAATLKLRLVRR